MKTFMLVLSVLSNDPSRPTESKVIRKDLTLEQCVALSSDHHWQDVAQDIRNHVYDCTPQRMVAGLLDDGEVVPLRLAQEGTPW